MKKYTKTLWRIALIFGLLGISLVAVVYMKNGIDGIYEAFLVLNKIAF